MDMRNASMREIYFKERERALKRHENLRAVSVSTNISPSLRLGLLRYGFDVEPFLHIKTNNRRKLHQRKDISQPGV